MIAVANDDIFGEYSAMPITIQEIPEPVLNTWRQDAVRIIKSATARDSLRALAERVLNQWGLA